MSDPALSLRSDQIEAAQFLRERSGRLLVADPGVGKSAAALLALEEFDLILIICNANARASWPGEIERWSYGTFGRKTRATHPTYVLESANDPLPPPGTRGFVIVTFDLLSMVANKRLRAALAGWGAQAAIEDEIQYLANKAANRTKAVYGARCDRSTGLLADRRIHVVQLSGTPQRNHQGELWTHYRAHWTSMFEPVVFSYDDWIDRFCVVEDGLYGRTIRGSKNIPMLRDALAPWVMRVRKSDLGFPPLTFMDTPIDVDPAALRAIPGLAVPDDIPEDDDQALIDWLNANELHLATARRALGIAKAPACAEWAEDFLQSSEKKLILFAYHTVVIDKLVALLGNHMPVRIDGRDGQAARVDAVNTFQMDRRCRVFVGHIVSASSAITLTAASDVGICEASWTPSDNYQAACRADRTGQTEPVLARFLQAPGTVDARIARAYRRKAKETAELFD